MCIMHTHLQINKFKIGQYVTVYFQKCIFITHLVLRLEVVVSDYLVKFCYSNVS